MAIVPKYNFQGKIERVEAATGQTIVKGDMLVDNGSGYLATASAGGGVTPTHIAMETVTTTANGDIVEAMRVNGVIFEADTDANPAQTDVGTFADIASKSTIDPDASADDIFYIEKIVGAATDNKVQGWFQVGAPNA